MTNDEIQIMKYPKISIVTPSYNQVEYLEQTICSVLNQNYPNLEYIIIDGGSTDGSVEIIKKYADKLAYWESAKDDGQYHAINKGFSKTTGDILAWINSSDVYFPWTFTFIAEIFSIDEKIEWISGMPSNIKTGNAPQSIRYATERNVYDIIIGNYKWIQQESTFWKRSLWIKAGGKLDTQFTHAGDFNLWLKFFNYSSLYYVNTILGGYRYHGISRGNDISGTYELEAKSLQKEFIHLLPFRIKVRGMLAKIFIGKNRLNRKLFKKLKVFRWYQHHNISYNFSSSTWVHISRKQNHKSI